MITFEEARTVALGRSALSGDNLHSLYQACQMVQSFPGSVAEVGVFKGGSAKFMMKCLPDKDFWLFDTFKGIPTYNQGGHPVGDFAADIAEVTAYLAEDGFDNFNIVSGVFPESIAPYERCLEDEEFCLVHLDTDTYEATRDGLTYFWPSLIVGGKFYIHDYDWHACPGVKPAVEEFLASLPAGSVVCQEIEVPGSIKYFSIVKLVNTPKPEKPIEEPVRAPVEIRKVEVMRNDLWEDVDSLLDVKVGDHFKMTEPDGEEVPGIWEAECEGFIDGTGNPAINAKEVSEELSIVTGGEIKPREVTEPLEEGELPEGLTAEPVKVEDLQVTVTVDGQPVEGEVIKSDVAGTGKCAQQKPKRKSALEQIADGTAKTGSRTKDNSLKAKP